jgi:hypothetical protein
MAISNRGEVGVGGGSRGGSGGGSVKVVKPTSAAARLEKNSAAKAKADTAKSGAWARYEAGQIEKKRQRPAKVTKINSAPEKSTKTKVSAKKDAKALKAANKKSGK